MALGSQLNPHPAAGGRREPLAGEMTAAAQALEALARGERFADALERATAPLARESRAPVRDMGYRVVRELARVQALARALNRRVPPPGLAALQWVALAQMIEALRPAAVIVDQAVLAARGLAGPPAGAFMNATLRRFAREKDGLLDQVNLDEATQLNYPGWWLALLRKAYPGCWRQIAQAGNAKPPLVLRVNLRRSDVASVRSHLLAHGIASRSLGHEAIALDKPLPVTGIPGFAQGWVSVQDAGAQRAAHLLDLAPGQRVLDACAAPGGKTAHILGLADVELLALDIDRARCERIRDNLAREGLDRLPQAPVEIRVADAARVPTWWDGRPFDRILLDAPCSASGIVRRQPDVRWLRRRGDLATLAQRQYELLESLWPLLAPDGKLLYVTCSVFPEEGSHTVQRFCRNHPEAYRARLIWPGPDGSPHDCGQLLPGCGDQDDPDGFFFALLSRHP